MSASGSKRLGRRGQAAVELALLLPVILLLVIGLIEMARAWRAHNVITDAAREGARRAAVFNPNMTQAGVDSAVRNALTRGGLNGYAVTTLVTIGGWRTGSGTPDSVRIDYPFQFFLLGPIIGWTTGQRSITMTSLSVMRNE